MIGCTYRRRQARDVRRAAVRVEGARELTMLGVVGV